jgi:hypothetical protein
VRLDAWAPSNVDVVDGYRVVAVGTEGTVGSHDAIGTLDVAWDDGARLGVTTDDRVTIVERAS